MAQAAVLEKPAEAPPPDIRRFELPDMDRHPWIEARLRQQYRHLTSREAIGWLRGIVYSNEFVFLFQPHAVGLAQIYRPTLAPKPVLQERFVWVEDPKDRAQLEAASWFYKEFEKRTLLAGLDTMILEESTDVPREMIKMRLPRIFTREQVFARLGD